MFIEVDEFFFELECVAFEHTLTCLLSLRRLSVIREGLLLGRGVLRASSRNSSENLNAQRVSCGLTHRKSELFVEFGSVEQLLSFLHFLYRLSFCREELVLLRVCDGVENL